MLQRTVPLRKNPVTFKQGQGMVTHQLKRLLQKNHLHYYRWDPLPMYDPRRLIHANRTVDHYTYETQPDPHLASSMHWVPDQEYEKIPIPPEYKDAYWWRDLQARRFQGPLSWVGHRIYGSLDRHFRYDFQDLAVKKKHMFTYDEAVTNARRSRT